MEVNDKVKDENVCVEQSGNQVIHVRGNSDSELQALFDCVLKPTSQMPLQKPFKMRDLPASFFTPPAHRQSPAPAVSHSREGSADSTYGSSGNGAPRVGGAVSPSPPQGPQHFRHHSSPASLQQTLSIAHPQNVHGKQHSFDALAEDAGSALPPGWEQARTAQGQIYYLNHITKSTTWEDPRKKAQSQSLSQPATSPQPSPTIQQAVPPPPPHTVQQPPPQSSSSHSQLVLSTTPSNAALATSSTTTSVSSGGISSTSSHQSIPLVNPDLGPLPDGWEQGISTDGNIYFIDHQTKFTTWFDPRIPRPLQTGSALKAASGAPSLTPANQTQNQTNQQLVHALPPVGPTGLNSPSSLQRQNLSLQRLQQEREKLRLRRQEIARIQVEFASRRNGRDDATQVSQSLSDGHQTSTVVQPHQQQLPSITQVTSSLSPLVTSVTSMPVNQISSVELTFTSADPFMATTDFHSRQESADSGLGLGSNYTHPHTPEDFLAAMDDVEITPSDELKQNSASPMIVGSELESMDSEDLVPSITINDDLSAEFLNDMLEPTKLENLQTWL